ncbi:N-6 DNA methylase [bacterium]|nr:N-6 DNA methylase [bacterium]
MLNQEIKKIVQNLWDRLWSGGHSNPITAIEQISYLLFMRRLEHFHPETPETYKWSNYKDKQGNELVMHMSAVFAYIQVSLVEDGEPFAKAMAKAQFEIENASLLESAIRYIDQIYEEIDKEIARNQHFHDVQGDVYEYLLSHTAEAGKNGQFRTPRHLIHMMAALLDPDTDGKICDLASGTGGFLVAAYQYIITKYSQEKSEDDDGLMKGTDGNLLSPEQKQQLKENLIYGFDIDRTMVQIGVMNLMMHGITKPHITHIDTLSAAYEAWEAQKMNIGDTVLSNPFLSGQYKYIMANPPFTGKIDSIGVSENLDRLYPPKYDKENPEKRVKQTVQSELLFLERIVYMLEDGGSAAVIVPEGVLFNSGRAHKKIREILMKDCELNAVISLPSGAFKPYTGVKTAILIFTKTGHDSEGFNTEKVWFYEMKSDGYSLDDNRKKLSENPLPKTVAAYNEVKQGQVNPEDRKTTHFYVPLSEIKTNEYDLSFNRYKEFVYEEKTYDPPKKILSALMEMEEEIMREMRELNDLIG